MSSRPVYRICAQAAPSSECLRGKGPPASDVGKTLAPSVYYLAVYTLWAKPGCCCYPAWQSVSFHCCPVWQTVVCGISYTRKIERFVLTIIKRRLLSSSYHAPCTKTIRVSTTGDASPRFWEEGAAMQMSSHFLLIIKTSSEHNYNK